MTEEKAQIRLLGAVAVDSAGDDALGPRSRQLLTALALNRGTPVSESSLIDIVWGGEGELPANPARSLQTHISRLRTLLGAEAIERTGAGYRLVAEHVWIDIAEFERRLDLAGSARTRGDDRGAIEDLDVALALWTGEALSDSSGELWATGEASRLNELRVDAQEQRAELLVGLDDVDGALIADLERLALAHPHRSGPTRQLMLALHRADRQADALAAFARHRDQLATDLGLDPPSELAVLESQILTDDPTVFARAGVRPLRGYEIIERLGEGAFSIVYRGSQPSVGREVAIKQIRAELANRPEFIRRFETEAHLVARLEHPHIVPLYDFWREPDSAYLVMRLLSGGNLETSLRSGPWDVERATHMIDQIGGALATAHRAGVVHRDVKPANILLDDIGNAYLTDFGIALEAHEVADPSAALSAGSPAYASPEQLRHETATPAADVHGMGIVLYETLTGRLPFPDELTQASLLQRQLHDPVPSLREDRPDLSPALDAVVAKATAKRAADRYGSVEAFVDAVNDAVNKTMPEMVRPGVTTAVGTGRNPYKGLRAFDEADADDFAGRSRLIDQLIARLNPGRFLAVVGPSGSGKSSVVRAGLLPALRAGGAAGSDDWFVTTMLPGPAPFEELETALLRIAPERPVDLLGVLTEGDRGIARGLRHAVPDENAQVLLVIDQFEELFTLADPGVARSFLDALAVAVTEERPRVRVVLTLRADFYDRPLRHEAIGRLVRDNTVAVLPLAADELEHAIVDPATAVGVMLEPGLVSQIVADVADQPGALPMLQYALTELYERAESGLLTQAAYRELGGVAGALGRRAEELYDDSSPEDQTAIRRVFGRLVTLGEGIEDTRRRAQRRELGDDDSIARVIDSFSTARLLSSDRDPQTREPTVEVAHEALIREWPRLRRWLDDDRDGLRLLGHLHATATDWDEQARPPGELYRGGRLEAAEEWTASHAADLNPIETAFVDASLAARDAEVEATARTTRRLRQRLTGVAVVAVLALLASVVAFQQQRSASQSADDAEAAQAAAETSAAEAEEARALEASARADADASLVLAEEQAFRSETDRLTAEATNLADTNPRAALLLAVAAHQRDPSPATLGGLSDALGSDRTLQRLNWGTPYIDVEWVSDNRVVGTRVDGLDLIDLGTGSVVDSVSVANAPQDLPNTGKTAIDESGTLLAVLSDLPDEGDAFLPSAVSVYTIGEGFELQFTAPLDAVGLTVAVSPSGDLIVATGTTQTETVVRAWSVSGTELWEPRVVMPRPASVFEQAAPLLGESLSPAGWEFGVGALGVSVTDDQVFVANGVLLHRLDHSGQSLGDPTLTTTLDGSRPRFATDVIETDSGWLVVDTLQEGAVAAVDDGLDWPEQLALRTLGPTNALGSQTAMTDAALAGDDLLTSRADGVLVTYNPVTAEETELVPLHAGRPEALALAPAGDRVVVAHSVGLSVLAVGDGGPLAVAIPRKPGLDLVSITGDGSTVLLSSIYDPSTPAPELWHIGPDGPRREPVDVIESSRTAVLQGNPDRIVTSSFPGGRQVDYSLDSFEVISDWPSPPTGTITLWPTQTPLGVLRGQAGRELNQIEPAILIYRDGEYEPEWILPPPGDGTADVGGLVLDPIRPRALVADADGNADIWDLESRTTVLDDFLGGQEISLGWWSKDGSLAVTAAPDGTISIRDGETFEVIQVIAGLRRLSGFSQLGFSPDNALLLTVVGGVGQLWDVATGERIGNETVTAAGTLPLPSVGDGQIRGLTATDTHALVWNLDVDTWADVACRAAGSNLTADEWAQWGPRDVERYAICPDAPLPS